MKVLEGICGHFKHQNSATGSRGTLILVMVLAIVASRRLLPLEAQTSSITGVVKSAAGEPVVGALVKVSNEVLGLGFMVVSQGQGRYSTPKLFAGKYAVQGFGGGYQSASASMVEVSKDQQGQVDVVLSAPKQIPPRVTRLKDADFEKLMPEGEVAGIRHSVSHQCNECHTLERIASTRKTREQWRATIDRMRDYQIEDRHPLSIRYLEDGILDPLWLDYLAKNLGPEAPQYPEVVKQWLLHPGSPSHPNRNWPTTLLKGTAAKYVAMEFSLRPGSAPGDIAVDSQEIVWVSERDGGMLGRFDPNSLAYTRIALPPAKNSKLQLNAVAVDPQDQVWLADDGPNARILQYNPKSQEFNSYPIPEFRWLVPDIGWARITTLRFLDGSVWATGETSDRILKLDPRTRKFIDYSIPRGSSPFGLATGANGIWYTALIGNSIVRLDPKTGRVEPHNLRTERSELKAMAADSVGNFWAAATDSGKLVKMDIREGDVFEFSPPTENSGPFAVDVDVKRNLVWFSEVFADKIARFDPSSNSFVEFPHPEADSDVRRIEIDRTRPNRVWWSSARADKIGYIEVLE